MVLIVALLSFRQTAGVLRDVSEFEMMSGGSAAAVVIGVKCLPCVSDGPCWLIACIVPTFPLGMHDDIQVFEGVFCQCSGWALWML